jgi:AcrR family transcriptional regulator
MSIVTSTETAADSSDSRQCAVLEAAVGVFARYGYRKASMDEVARAAGVSRQGLYLQFANKEELFRRALEHSLDRQLSAAATALGQRDIALEDRLAAACDAWAGRFIGALGAGAADLMCAGTTLAGAALARYGAEFESLVARAVDESPLSDVYSGVGLSSLQIARTLHATARGFKHGSASRAEFLNAMTAAARIICAPLNS